MYVVPAMACRLDFDVRERRWRAAGRVRGSQRRQPEVRKLALQRLRLLALDLAECGLLRLACQGLDRAGVEVELALCSPR